MKGLLVLVIAIATGWTASGVGVAQQPHETVGGTAVVRIPNGASRELGELVTPDRAVCGACDLVFVYKLIEPAGMQMPKNVFVQRFVHQMGYARPESLVNAYGCLLTSGHGGFQILNKSGRAIAFEIEYAGWK